MKKLTASAIALITFLVLTSCDESREIRRNMDGVWRVESVMFMTEMHVDSVWEFDNLTFEFERCSRRKNKGSTELCKLFIKEGQNLTIFEYQVTPEGQLYFDLASPHTPSKFDAVLISPNFDITTLTDSNLLIRNQSKPPFVLSYTEIRAERQ
jgi:hypothetical protein